MAERFVGSTQVYKTIANALLASVSGDIITITDSAVYREFWFDLKLENITLRSNQSAPDNFPVLQINMNNNTLDMMNNWNYKYLTFEQNQSCFSVNLRKVAFFCCVFRNYDHVFDCDAQQFGKELNSCLFYNIRDYILNAARNYANASFVFRNTTFHNCTNLFKNDFGAIDYTAYPKIYNCLFTNCPNLASSVSDKSNTDKRSILFSQFHYCTFTNNLQTINAKFNSSCKIDIPLNDTYPSVNKAVPSDFQISDNQNVRNAGSSIIGYPIDIAGRQRNDPYDIGAWEVLRLPTLSAPIGVNASDGIFTNKIEITWESVVGALNYEVYRSTSQNGIYNKISTLSITGTSFSDYDVVENIVYWYKVKAKAPNYNDSDLSAPDQGYTRKLPIQFTQKYNPFF